MWNKEIFWLTFAVLCVTGIQAFVISERGAPQSQEKIDAVCLACQAGMTPILTMLSHNATYDEFLEQVTTICFSLFPFYDEDYCNGYLNIFAPHLYYVLTANPDLTVDDICGELLTTAGCKSKNPARDWNLEIPGTVSPYVEPQLPPRDSSVLKFLQISDTHVDPYYSPGSNAVCDFPMCCRDDFGTPQNDEDKAWYWGDYRNCGLPPWTFENMLDHIKNTHPDIDFVLWTGDVIPHSWWNTSEEFNLMAYNSSFQAVLNTFTNIPVFPVVGNHDSSPVDQWPGPGQAPPGLNNLWVYEDIVEKWDELLPPGFDASTIFTGGYYSVLLRPGLRILSVNSNWGYTPDVWLLDNSVDLGGVLTWLIDELLMAEASGEFVYLIGHIPPGNPSVERTYSREFNRMIDRFSNIIRGQFYGHTHVDEFEVFHSSIDGTPCNVAYIAPSVTTWSAYNPAYRVFTMDGQRPDTTWAILDFETWYLNIEKANEDNEPTWESYYSPKESYSMNALNPSDWESFAYRALSDDSLFDSYYEHYCRNAPHFMARGCNASCKNRKICEMLNSNRMDLDDCYQNGP